MSKPTQFSNADAAWLHMDRPTNLMVINSVLLFDEPLDWDRLADVVGARLVEPYPRFRQCVAERRLPVGPRWEDDDEFDLARHMHRLGLPAPGDEAALKALAGDLASTPLDRDKPLWDMYLIDGPGDGSAVIVRMHHCIADGIALAEVLLSLADADRDGARPLGTPPPAGPPPDRADRRVAGVPVAALGDPLAAALSPARAAAGVASRLALGVAREGMRTLARPRRAVELGEGLADDARALGKMLLAPDEEPTALKGAPGTARDVAWSEPLSLERVKAIAHAQNATVNDVLLAAVSGALRGHLIACGQEPQELHASVPVNLRPAGSPVPRELGNRFGLVSLALPVDRSGHRERLSELKLRMGEIKRSPEAPLSYAVLSAVGMTPPDIERRLIDMFTAKGTAVMTNVPGPRDTVYLAGSRLRSVLVWAPTAGSVGMSVSIFSYAGEIIVGLLVHAELVPDPQGIVDRVDREVRALGRLASVAGGAR